MLSVITQDSSIPASSSLSSVYRLGGIGLCCSRLGGAVPVEMWCRTASDLPKSFSYAENTLDQWARITLILCSSPSNGGRFTGGWRQAVVGISTHPPQLHLVSRCVALHISPRGSLRPEGVASVSQGGKGLSSAVTRVAFLLALSPLCEQLATQLHHQDPPPWHNSLWKSSLQQLWPTATSHC